MRVRIWFVMQSIQHEYNMLKAKYEQLESEANKVYQEYREKRKQLIEEQQKEIQSEIPRYIQKLNRLKAYIHGFENEVNRRRVIDYAFRKVDVYSNDFHLPVHDPLNWSIHEFDLLDMNQCLEIIIDYSHEGVKLFVQKWLAENVPGISECELNRMTKK